MRKNADSCLCFAKNTNGTSVRGSTGYEFGSRYWLEVGCHEFSFVESLGHRAEVNAPTQTKRDDDADRPTRQSARIDDEEVRRLAGLE